MISSAVITYSGKKWRVSPPESVEGLAAGNGICDAEPNHDDQLRCVHCETSQPPSESKFPQLVIHAWAVHWFSYHLQNPAKKVWHRHECVPRGIDVVPVEALALKLVQCHQLMKRAAQNQSKSKRAQNPSSVLLPIQV